MIRSVTLALAVSLGLSAPLIASPVNFEYTVTPNAVSGSDPQTYTYDMQFWVDMDEVEALGWTDTIEVRNLSVNRTGAGPFAQPGPFGRNFVTETQDGWQAGDFFGTTTSTILSLTAGGSWRPTADDFFVRFSGVSEVNADMTWRYSGIGIPGDNSTLFDAVPFQDRVAGFRTSAPVDALTDFTPPDNPSPIPLPAGFPLLLAALGGLAFARRRTT